MLGFVNHYADVAIRIIEHPANQTAWHLMGFKIGDNILFEQYLLSACIAYHANHETSPFYGVHVQCLFGSAGDAFTPDRAREAGYTHLIGGAKRNDELAHGSKQGLPGTTRSSMSDVCAISAAKNISLAKTRETREHDPGKQSTATKTHGPGKIPGTARN